MVSSAAARSKGEVERCRSRDRQLVMARRLEMRLPMAKGEISTRTGGPRHWFPAGSLTVGAASEKGHRSWEPRHLDRPGGNRPSRRRPDRDH